MTSLISGFQKILGFLTQNLRWIITGVVLLVGMNLATTCANNSTWNAKYNAYKVHADSVNKFYIDSLERINTIHLASVADHKAEADALIRRSNALSASVARLNLANRHLNDSINKLLINWKPGEPINPLVCEMCLRARIGMLHEIDSLNTRVGVLVRLDTTRLQTIADLDVVVANRGIEIDTLRRTIRDWPKPQAPPRLFGIFKVTPSQSFFVGTGVGLILSIIVPKL